MQSQLCLVGSDLPHLQWLSFARWAWECSTTSTRPWSGAPGSSLIDLCELLAAWMMVVAHNGGKVCWVHKENTLHMRAKGKTRKGTKEMTSGDLLSNCKQKQTG